MEVKYQEQIERSYYTCDICGERVKQGGGDIVLLYSDGEKRGDKPHMHFHETCLAKRFKK